MSTLESVKPIKGKSLDLETQKHVRAFVQNVIQKEFNGNVSNAARAFGIWQSTLYEFLSGTRGPGMKLIAGVARFSRVSIDEVVGSAVPTSRPKKNNDRYPNRGDAIVMAKSLGYHPKAIEEVQSIALKSQSGGADKDPPARWWLERIQLRSKEIESNIEISGYDIDE